jgi:fructokinase
MPTRGGPIVGLGEVLWDLLPAGRQLGGAPFNFTHHCHQLGHPAVMVSRVGADEPGQTIRSALMDRQLSDVWIQTDDRYPTGSVEVTLNEHGHPTYTIAPDVAYDHLQWTDELASLLSTAAAVCFGTLAQRHPVSRATIQQAIRQAAGTVILFDINLRQHFYSRELIEQSLRCSRWVKLNDEELQMLRSLLGLAGATEIQTVSNLRSRYNLELIALTRGERGCLLQTELEQIDLPGIRVKVADTVGAGDAFSAGLLVSILQGDSVSTAARFANRLAACVASKPGGTPVVTRAEIEAIDSA